MKPLTEKQKAEQRAKELIQQSKKDRRKIKQAQKKLNKIIK